MQTTTPTPLKTNVNGFIKAEHLKALLSGEVSKAPCVYLCMGFKPLFGGNVLRQYKSPTNSILKHLTRQTVPVVTADKVDSYADEAITPENGTLLIKDCAVARVDASTSVLHGMLHMQQANSTSVISLKSLLIQQANEASVAALNKLLEGAGENDYVLIQPRLIATELTSRSGPNPIIYRYVTDIGGAYTADRLITETQLSEAGMKTALHVYEGLYQKA